LRFTHSAAGEAQKVTDPRCALSKTPPCWRWWQANAVPYKVKQVVHSLCYRPNRKKHVFSIKVHRQPFSSISNSTLTMPNKAASLANRRRTSIPNSVENESSLEIRAALTVVGARGPIGKWSGSDRIFCATLPILSLPGHRAFALRPRPATLLLVDRRRRTGAAFARCKHQHLCRRARRRRQVGKQACG
jgi:hypothetical protein